MRRFCNFFRIGPALLVILVLAVLSPLLLPASQSLAAPVPVKGMCMFSYGGHNSAYDSRLLAIVPEYLIDNTAHGFWGEYTGSYGSTSLLQNVSRMQAAGMKVIGYTSCGYEGRGSGGGQPLSMFTLASVKKQITNMAQLDGVNGVFIDEVDAYPSATQKQYLKELSTLAHSLGIVIWGNTGVNSFDAWFFGDGGFDFVHSTEQWTGQALTATQKTYGSRISVAGFKSTYAAADAVRLTQDAWSKGIRFCYVNNAEYQTIAPWFEQYANSVRGAAAPPAPAPVNGAPVLGAIGSKTVTQGQLLQFRLTATDPDGNSLTYSASNLPAGATFTASTATFSWRPASAGTHSGITFRVSDGSLSDSETMTITVVPADTGNPAPTPTPTTGTTFEITARVTTGADDGFAGSWGFYRSLSWYETGNPGQPYGSWYRFAGVKIPAGAKIVQAHLVTTQSKWTSGTHLKIRAERSASPLAPTSTAGLASKTRTLAGADWDSGYSDRRAHQSPDITAVIQELVGSYSYSSGGTIQILVDNDGSVSGSEHVGATFEGSSAPVLYIKYQLP